MKYIEKIIIENFQSHKFTVLELDKGVNVIIGPSDSGKTSIIRAIRWVMYNEPSGDYFIRKGEIEASVTLYLNNGYIIKRGRNKNKNYYEVIDNCNNKEHYEGFGTNVPLEVSEILGVNKVQLSENYNLALNISEQLDNPFLLNDTPTIKSNAIGKLAGADIIDDALQKLSKDIYSLKTELKYNNNELDLLKQKKENYKTLKNEKKEIDELKIIINNLKEKQLLIEKLKEYEKQFKYNTDSIKIYRKNLKKYTNIVKIENNIDIINENLIKLEFYRNSYKRLKDIDKTLEKSKNIVDKTKMLDLINQNAFKSEELLRNYVSLIQINDMQNNINDKIKLNNIIIEKYSLINSEDLLKKTNLLYSKYNKLKEISNSNSNINNRIKNGNIYMNKFNNFNKLSSHVNLLNNKIVYLNKLYLLSTELDKLNIKITEIQKNLLVENNRAEINLKEYIGLLNNFLICPICKSKIDKEHINKIISEYRGV